MTSQVERQSNLLQDCLNSLKTWKELIDTHLEGEERTAETSELEEVVKEYCLIQFNASKTSEACEEVLDYFNDDSADPKTNVDDLYAEKLASKQENFSSDYKQDRIWKEVFSDLRDFDVEVQEEDQSQEETEYEELGDSIMYSSVFTPPVDPISKKVIRDPYKNKRCGHVYEQKFIIQYIKSMKNKAKCPYMGCANMNINIGDLLQDTETQNKITEYLSQHNNSQ